MPSLTSPRTARKPLIDASVIKVGIVCSVITIVAAVTLADLGELAVTIVGLAIVVSGFVASMIATRARRRPAEHRSIHIPLTRHAQHA